MDHPLDADEGRDLFETMLAHSTEARWYVISPSLVAPQLTPYTREELIASVMLVPVYHPCTDAAGHAQFGEPHYLTREEAERQIGDYRLAEAEAA